MVISSNPADINECLTLGLCRDSECVNTRGSYLCTCKPGLMLDPSRSRCVCECGWGTGAGDTGGKMGPLGFTGQAQSRSSPQAPSHGPAAATQPGIGPSIQNGSVPSCGTEAATSLRL